MATPLRPRDPSSDTPEEGDTQSHEALLISALLESGRFNPQAHHVTSDNIAGWGKVWAFCTEYQDTAGAAPPLHLLKKIHPEFVHTPGISAAWAATKVLEDSASRDLRVRTHQSLQALGEGDIEMAFASFDNLQRPRGHTLPPSSVFDVSTVLAGFEVERVEVPYPSLRRMLDGGLVPSEYLVIAARLNQGKSHIAHRFSAVAMAAGWRCAYMSLEMPARQVNLRTLKHLCGSNYTLFEQLNSDEETEIKKAVEHLQEMTPGSLDVYDPSHGQVGTTTMFADLARDYDVVFVDHLGLMKTSRGQRAIEDWRVQATVSNIIREITLDTQARAIAVAQVNRSGEHRGTMTTPKASEISQADAIGQDATAVLTFKRLSKHIAKFSLEKSRDGATGAFYARFDPGRNRWDELPKDMAIDISHDDEQIED